MYGSSPAAESTSKGLNPPNPPPTVPFGDHRQEDAESELLRRRHQHQQQQMSSGLLRFRSAPSSLFEELCEDSFPLSAEAENKFARFLAPDPLGKPSGGATVDCQKSPQFRPPAPLPSAEMVSSQQKVAFSSDPPMLYRHSHQSQQLLQMPTPNHSFAESSHQAAMEMQQIERGGSNSDNLTRQSSSPAGLFSHLNADNGYAMLRGLSGFRNGDLPPMGDAAKRLRGQLSFSSRQNSLMSQISEMGSEEMGQSSPDESGGGGRCYITGVPVTSWEETSLISGNNFLGIGRDREGEGKMVSGLNLSESQSGEMRNHVSGITHQLSLPKTSSEMTSIEKFLQFQDAVPCRIRAKRGCATHPRSIAERVRRTKISERMRKLQDLVPNMDKQTNTADMLDLAVDYIKDLQKQVKALTESRGSCSCSSSKQKPHLN